MDIEVAVNSRGNKRASNSKRIKPRRIREQERLLRKQKSIRSTRVNRVEFRKEEWYRRHVWSLVCRHRNAETSSKIRSVVEIADEMQTQMPLLSLLLAQCHI